MAHVTMDDAAELLAFCCRQRFPEAILNTARPLAAASR
jgi:hypothetical protein